MAHSNNASQGSDKESKILWKSIVNPPFIKLVKSNPTECHFYLYKGVKKNRIKKNLIGKKMRSSASKKHEKGGKEPWLIATSLSPENYTASEIIDLYKLRMQIEESFRDLKNTRNGFSLRHCRSFSIQRLNVALLISAIAMLLLWSIALCAKKKKLHFSYQANSIKTHNVLSDFIIGWQVLKRSDYRYFKLADVITALGNFSLVGDFK